MRDRFDPSPPALGEGLRAYELGMVRQARDALAAALDVGLPVEQDAVCRALLGFCLLMLGDDVDERLLGPALRAADRGLRVFAMRTLATATWNRTGDMAATTELLSELGQLEGSGAGIPWSDAVIRSQILFELGQFEAARRLAAYGIERMPTPDEDETLTDADHRIVHAVFARILVRTGLPADGRRAAEQAMAMAGLNPVARAVSLLALGECETAGVEPVEARAYLREGEVVARAQGLRPVLLELIGARAELARRLGDDWQAERRRGLELAKELGFPRDIERFSRGTHD